METGSNYELSTGKIDVWAVVDVMGHQRFVGRVTEQVVAGHGMVRVDVPAVGDRPAFTKLIGPGSIYAISPLGEETARAMIENTDQAPLSRYDVHELISATKKPRRIGVDPMDLDEYESY